MFLSVFSSFDAAQYPFRPRGSLNFHLILRERSRIFQWPHVLKWHLLFLWLDYTVMRGMGTSGNVEYRCWPSYSQQGCVLSVHSAREAALICNSHSQCSSFTLTGQKTWTGQWRRTFFFFFLLHFSSLCSEWISLHKLNQHNHAHMMKMLCN